MPEPARLRPATYAGLFLVSSATLMYETLLTRIFSVTMWYHFAFLAVSVALFGMTVGAIVVYLYPRTFTPERARRQLALSTLLFALSVPASFLVHLALPLGKPGIPYALSMGLTYAVIAIPFVFSGISICLALTRFSQQVSWLYAADLAGASIGCLLLIYALRLTDGPTAVMVAALLAALAALLFAYGAQWKGLLRGAALLAVLLSLFVGVNTVLQHQQRPLLRLTWVKGQYEAPPLYEKWNSFSRITVVGDPDTWVSPVEWGVSRAAPATLVRLVQIVIDASASTQVVDFAGDWSRLDYLRYDIANVVHYIRHNGHVLVVGAGGGRDVLSALLFDQRAVTAVEINGDIIATVNGVLGDFTGHLDRDPRVTFVEDEARSYIARQPQQYDIIHISLIDTWAATAAGAFVLSENSLYTVEAWEIFMQRLNPNGVLSVTRWYFRDGPGEMYRLTMLAATTLQRLGIANPRDHIIIVRLMLGGEGGDSPDGFGTLLVSKEPFSPADVATVEQLAQERGFEIVLTPRFARDATFERIASGQDLARFAQTYPLNIAAPTDNSPFFFHMLRLRDIFDTELWNEGVQSFNRRAVVVLGTLLIIVAVLTFLCIIVPLLLTLRRGALRGNGLLFLFFAGIGLGYMLVEISQMQRLVVFLGHPTYSLSVVLFSLLLSSGLGSSTTNRIKNPAGRPALLRLGVLLGVLVLFGTLTPTIVEALQGAVTPVRIAVAVAILFPLGFFMGMAFPLGMKLASARSAALTPWLWGINGALSVCASVLAVAIAMNWGIATSFWTGFSGYLVAGLAFVLAARQR